MYDSSKIIALSASLRSCSDAAEHKTNLHWVSAKRVEHALYNALALLLPVEIVILFEFALSAA
jgi:hypothetical protein